MAGALFQAFHVIILVGVIAWLGYLLVKLVGPMLAPGEASWPPLNRRAAAASGILLLALLMLDQFLLGRFR